MVGRVVCKLLPIYHDFVVDGRVVYKLLPIYHNFVVDG